jgi:hypothetical protein
MIGELLIYRSPSADRNVQASHPPTSKSFTSAARRHEPAGTHVYHHIRHSSGSAERHLSFSSTRVPLEVNQRTAHHESDLLALILSGKAKISPCRGAFEGCRTDEKASTLSLRHAADRLTGTLGREDASSLA